MSRPRIKAFVKWFPPKRPRPVQLIEGLEPFDVEVVSDLKSLGSPCTAMQAWRKGAISDCSHVAVFDDDVILSERFAAALESAIVNRPYAIVNLIWMRYPYHHGKVWECFDEATKRHWAWVIHNVFQFGCGAIMPREYAAEFPTWCDREIVWEAGLFDDLWLRLFSCAKTIPYLQTVPCIIQHDPAMTSLIGATPNKLRQGDNFFPHADVINWNTPSMGYVVSHEQILWENRDHLKNTGKVWQEFSLGRDNV